MMSAVPGHQNLVTSSSFDPYWKAVRRGIAPAFSQPNLKWGPLLALDPTESALAAPLFCDAWEPRQPLMSSPQYPLLKWCTGPCDAVSALLQPCSS